jgi:ADP-ribose pyrophosphatase YjhB (NUDIX family)
MLDSSQGYTKINSIKVIVENKDGKILLIQEPETDEWMPLHWGLPGGRPKLKESLHGALRRTVKEEAGIEIEPLGIYKIEEVLHEDRTVIMFIAIARYDFEEEIKGQSESYRWVDAGEVAKMDTSEFTAFYAKDLILDYLVGNREYVDFKLIETQQYYGLDESPEYQKWIESGRKNA